ncbi:MAG: CinA family protein [Xanthomonadales bacterium]|nr:CinA family protein [Xanthomonadales bacterium]
MRYDDEALSMLASALAAEMRNHGHRLVTAESCTGGWIAKVCTDLRGSSEWFERGLVSYSNEAKSELMGVRASDIHRFGAVSEEVAAAMARGAVEHSHADVAVSVSGIAGPDGGTPDKPVGTVCFGWALPGDVVETEMHRFNGDRDEVRRASVAVSLRGLLERLGG